jgi:hypothetical protein
MDDRLEKALEFANYRITNETQRRNMEARIDSMLTLHHNQGIFKADPTTIAFVGALSSNTSDDYHIIVDVQNRPIEVTNIKVLLDELLSTYASTMNEMLTQHNKLKKSRNVKKLISRE